ncbi:unnamed protein product, partial [Polarella glacialis]
MPSDCGAERICEVPVTGFAVDCSAHGEPFCVIFWPELGTLLTSGSENRVRLEVSLFGLRGPQSELSFFYEVAPFRQDFLDACLHTEAMKLQESSLADASLWRNGTGLPDLAPIRRAHTLPSGPEPVKLKPLLQPVFPPGDSFEVEGVDMLLTVHGPVSAVRAELYIVRLSGDDDVVPRGTQATRMRGDHFLLRLKLPMPRAKYELRIWPEPNEDLTPPLRFGICLSAKAAPHTTALLTSLDDSSVNKFGYAPVTAAMQAHAVVLLAPLMYRIPIGATCYFLIYVDKEAALVARSTIGHAASGVQDFGPLADAGGTGVEQAAAAAAVGCSKGKHGVRSGKPVASRAEAGDPPTRALYPGQHGRHPLGPVTEQREMCPPPTRASRNARLFR